MITTNCAITVFRVEYFSAFILSPFWISRICRLPPLYVKLLSCLFYSIYNDGILKVEVHVIY
jgi:hypothetical protein